LEIAHSNVSIKQKDGTVAHVLAQEFIEVVFPSSRGGYHGAVPRNPEIPHTMTATRSRERVSP